MTRTLRMPAALVASLCLSSIPLLAQHGGGRASGHVSVSHAAPRVSAPHVMSAPSRTFSSASRGFSGPARTGTFGPPRVVYAQSRGGGAHVTGPSHGTAVVRSGGVYHGGYYGGHYGGYYGGYYGHPIHYSYPYYTFHSHFTVGFGIYVGYPFAFSAGFYYGYPYYGYGYYPPYPYYAYPYPYYPPAPAYGYPAPYGSMGTYPQGYPADPQQGYPPQPAYPQQQAYPQQPYPQQPQSSYPEPTSGQPQQNNPAIAQPGTAAGGISFDISPETAAVIIDGTYVGRVSDLGPTTQPMGLKPGRHHVEIRAPGYETVTFDADIVAGQVLPYKGQMQPIR